MPTADRARGRRLIWMMLGFVVIALVAVWLRLGSVENGQSRAHRDSQTIIDNQKAGTIRGLKLRAIGCRNIEIAGGKFIPGDPCLDPEIRPYFRPDPEAVS